MGGCSSDSGHLAFNKIPLVDVDDATAAEIGTGLAAIGIDRMQLGIHGADVDPLLARLARGDRFRLPIRDAAILQIRLGQRLEHRLGVVGPFDFSGVGLKRKDPVKRRT